MALTIFAGVLTVGSTIVLTLYLQDALGRTIQEAWLARYVELSMFYVPVYMVICGNLVYLIARFGFFQRLSRYRPEVRSAIEDVYARADCDLVVLVPSYKEEETIIRQTLISGALVEFPRRRVVLLIDDPPSPGNPADESRIAAARQLPAKLSTQFAAPAEEFQSALTKFLARQETDAIDAVAECRNIMRLYERAATWLEVWELAFRRERCGRFDHTDTLFAEKILRAPAKLHRDRARELARMSLDADSVRREYCRLASLFQVEFASFERKRYVNLSHEPNKAMNLNSYLALLGHGFCEVERPDGLHLEGCDSHDAPFRVPNATYVIILDADSLIVSDYALRLVHVMEQPGNERIALGQTPYLTIRGSPQLIERTAGATTDLHYIIQQGMSRFNAAFWVGPNSLVRTAALADIEFEVRERGHPIKVYIRDRTVIEDSDTTVDLIRKNWRLYNHMSPMAYSATPADFGALVIQRQRWANGGLLILPSLIRHLTCGTISLAKLREGLLRAYSLVSACWIGLSMFILIFFSFDDNVVTLWLPLAAAPYYVLLSRDLVLAGYRFGELFRIFALQLLLVPVLIGGTLASLRQACTGRKAVFARTPKISGRTSTPLRYLAAIYLVLIFSAFAAVSNFMVGRHYHGVLSMVVFLSYLYGAGCFIGFHESWEDLVADLRRRSSWRSSARGFSLLGSCELTLAPLVAQADRRALADTPRRQT